MIPVHNLIHHQGELAACSGFRLFSEQSLPAGLPPVRVMQYAFGLVLRGTGTETIGLQAYTVRPHTVVFTFPGQIVSYADTSPDLAFVYCVFDEDFITSPQLNRALLDGFGFFRADGLPVFQLTAETAQLAQQLLTKIQNECAGQRPDYQLLVRLHLHELFVLLHREYPSAESIQAEKLSRGQQLSRQFKELVSQHFLTKKQVQDYAALLCITPRHLTDTVTSSTGRAPSQWILTMEMLEAKHLLKHSNRPVAAIADHLGYPDPAYFSKVFRKATGCSPQQYRQS